MSRPSVIIVTYNSAAVIRECLDGLAGADLEIIVIDNASSDNTVEVIRQHYPDVALVENADNIGYGAANNQGVRRASGDLFAILNPDLIVTPESLDALFDYLRANPDVGVVGPRALDGEGALVDTALPAYTPLRVLARHFALERRRPALVYGDYPASIWQATTPVDVNWLQGSCLVMPRDLFMELGGFDTGFFLFAEDADLCQRVREAGKRVVYHGGINVTHYLSTSTSRAGYISVRSYHISPLHYFRKRGRRGAVGLLKLGFTLELLIKIVKRGLCGDREDMRIHIRTLGDVWRY